VPQYISKYINNHATDDVKSRGKKIYIAGGTELIENDEMNSRLVFRVKDDRSPVNYGVTINNYAQESRLMLQCKCTYNLSNICPHEVAALLRLQDLFDRNALGSIVIEYDQRHTEIRMKTIDLKTIRLLTSPDLFEQADLLLRKTKALIIRSADERVEAELTNLGTTYKLIIQKNEDRNFDTYCNCSETAYPLCEHKTMLFLQLLNAYGASYFDSIRNLEKEKNKILQIYGYSTKDDLKGKFEFTIKDGKPFLKVLDPSIKRLETFDKTPAPIIAPPQEAPAVILPKKIKEVATKFSIGIVLDFNTKRYPHFSAELIRGEIDPETNALLGKLEHLDLNKNLNLDEITDREKKVLTLLGKMQFTQINRFLARPFNDFGFVEYIHDEDDPSAETKSKIDEYLHPKLVELFNELHEGFHLYYLPKGKKFITANLIRLNVEEAGIIPEFTIKTDGDNINLVCMVRAHSNSFPFDANEIDSRLVYLSDECIYTWQKLEDIKRVSEFLMFEKMKLNRDNWTEQMESLILPLSREYPVQFDASLVKNIRGIEPECQIKLVEQIDFLIFQPVFVYQGHAVLAGEKSNVFLPIDKHLHVIHRNAEWEESFLRMVESLHSNFIPDSNKKTFSLRGKELPINNWFFLFLDTMKEMKVQVLGMDKLNKYRFNTARPKTHIHVSSGLDWFDARIEVEFGSQRVGIADIKQALSSNQTYVSLNDGTHGILPEEWLKRYSLLFKVGDGKSDRLRLSKYHLGVIDELYEQRDEQEISFELDEKFEKIRAFKKIPEVNVPENLHAVLRPYQVAGYHWLNYLREVGWGGILADDMGLGKTVQALTMMQAYRKEAGSLLALVVCPTTLIYNWQNEVKKFTPEMTLHVHHGSARTRNVEELKKTDIIITTYGTLRSDIQLFLSIGFDYIVLDESQAIKNPASKVAKATTLLQAKHKICMSGTPLQNNTFDLFAQMNFLNPGLLGSMEFFRNEFATPIDKFNEPEQKEHLRKLLYPFVLRRTKEQVAKDLPEKTETILFCEMEEKQRVIYDAFRNSYRDKILGTIEEQGIEKSQLTILQGLMKLRQICDSPAILNEDAPYPNHSIKLDELTRELSENIGSHKALVFSQFIGMLSLIREKLKELNIPFEYFDGSTSATERERAIQNFQQNDSCRVFLISLKAGGVGLNLTAADYVYLVDPWWNPAVEQQAIDRTHRIGQTKNIFAYRMICVDSIEDKILQLQEKKKILAKELISDESSFVKTLTKADVEYLFS
jgi:non-specific serine/threonine protein kinase